MANVTIESFLVRNTRQAIGHQKFTTSEFSDDDSGRPFLSQDVSEGEEDADDSNKFDDDDSFFIASRQLDACDANKIGVYKDICIRREK